VVALAFPAATTAHIRYGGNCDPYGYCEYFHGDTVNPSNHAQVRDPINIAWAPYGGWENHVKPMLNNQFGWTHTCGSDQANYRLIGTTDQIPYWGWTIQSGQRGSAGCPPSTFTPRYHVRVWMGHSHFAQSDNWSISGAHHEDAYHSIDAFWDDVKIQMRSFALNFGHTGENDWTYLPRANGVFMGYSFSSWRYRPLAGVTSFVVHASGRLAGGARIGAAKGGEPDPHGATPPRSLAGAEDLLEFGEQAQPGLATVSLERVDGRGDPRDRLDLAAALR
jgi:hypothetical protein